MGVLASLFYTLPILLESGLTVIPWWYGNGYCALTGLNLSLGEKIASTFTFTGDWQWGYAGRTVFALAAIGGVSALLRRKGYAAALLAVLALSLFMTWGPYACFFSAQGQYLVYAVVIATVGAGVFVAEVEHGLVGDVLSRILARLPVLDGRIAARTWALAAVLCLIAFDMLRYLLFVNYLIPPTPYGSPPNRVAAHRWLVDHRAEIRGRVLDPSQPDNGWQIPMIAGIPTFQDNGDSPVYSAAFLRNLRPLGPNPGGIAPYSMEELFGPAKDLLLIANVDWAIADRPTPLQSLSGAVLVDENAVLLPTGGGLPMIASRSVRVMPQPQRFADLASEMHLERDQATAAFLPVQSAAAPLPGALPSGGRLAVTVYEHKVESQYVRLRYALTEPAYLQLSYGYYPYLRVTIDGQQTTTFPTTFGLIGLTSPAGRHTIEVVPVLSPLRRVVGVVNVGALLCLAALCLMGCRRKTA